MHNTIYEQSGGSYTQVGDYLLPAAAEGQQLRRAAVEYASEARLGDRLTVTTEESGGSFFISGMTSGAVKG